MLELYTYPYAYEMQPLWLILVKLSLKAIIFVSIIHAVYLVHFLVFGTFIEI